VKPWRLHIALAVLMLAQVATWAALHKTDDVVARNWAGGTSDERVEALFLQANRGEPNPKLFDREFVGSILEHETDDRIREFVFANDLCKFDTEATRGEYIYRGFGPGGSRNHHLLCWLIHYRRVGSLRLELNETGWFLDLLAGRPIDWTAVNEHMQQRIAETRYRRDLKEQEEAEALRGQSQGASGSDSEGND